MLRTTLTQTEFAPKTIFARSRALYTLPKTRTATPGPSALRTHQPNRPLYSTAIASSSTTTAPSLSSSTTAKTRNMSTSPTPTAPKDASRRRASGYRYWLDVQTRWWDNDQYSHINNSCYGVVSDAAINAYLIDECGLEPHKQPPPAPPNGTLTPRDVLGLMISTSATFYAPATFPCVLRVGLRVIKLGSSSVLFEMGIFELDHKVAKETVFRGDELACTITRATHVYVDRVDRRPVRPMPERIMVGLDRLRVVEFEVERERVGKL